MSTSSTSDDELAQPIAADRAQITEEILNSVDRYLLQKGVQLEKTVNTMQNVRVCSRENKINEDHERHKHNFTWWSLQAISWIHITSECP